MLRYILHKLALIVPTIIGISLASFFFVRLLPGDPILAMFNPDDYTKEALDAYRRQYGYTGTIFEQYVSYVRNVFQGHFGMSSMSNRDALAVVLERVAPHDPPAKSVVAAR